MYPVVETSSFMYTLLLFGEKVEELHNGTIPKLGTFVRFLYPNEKSHNRQLLFSVKMLLLNHRLDWGVNYREDALRPFSKSQDFGPIKLTEMIIIHRQLFRFSTCCTENSLVHHLPLGLPGCLRA